MTGGRQVQWQAQAEALHRSRLPVQVVCVVVASVQEVPGRNPPAGRCPSLVASSQLYIAQAAGGRQQVTAGMAEKCHARSICEAW